MATGGPYSQEARTGFDPALAMAEATDPAMAIVGTGQPTNTTTRRTPAVPMEEQRSGGEQFSVGIDSPVYGWSLNDRDLGQGNVQQIRTDNFVTPVAEQKLPFGAIAARQQGLANRRMQLEDAKAKALKDFDPLKGIRDPAAQHQAAFANYTTKVWWPETIQGAMDAMGFPTKAATIDWMVNDPEGKAYLKMKAKLMDAAAAESFGRTERGIDIMADVQANNTWLPPDQKKALSDYLNNYGESGVPNTGESIDEFIGAGRRADPVISLGEFQKQFVNGFKQYGEQLVKEGTIRRLPGGKYEITDEQILDFEPYKEAMVQEAARAGAMGGDVEAIREHFDAIIKPQIERKTRSWSREKPSGGLGSGEAVKKGGDYPLSESKLPTSIREDKPKQGEPGYGVIKNENDKYQTISLTEPVSKKEQIPQTRSFVKNGDDTPMIPLRLMDVDGTLYIVGKESRYTGETSVGGSSGGGRMSLDDEDETPAAVSSIADFKRLPDIRVPYSGNETVFEEYFPGLDEESVMEIFGSRSKGKNSETSAAPGYSIGQVDEGYKYIGGDPTSPDSWKSVSENSAKSPTKQAASPSLKSSPAKTAVTAKEQPVKEVLKQEQSQEEHPVIHTKKAVADTLLSQKKDGYEAMSERLDKNYEPGVYRYKNQQEADAELDAKKVETDANRVANDDDPKGFFKGGVMVESKIGNKKVFFIMDRSGMRPLSNYFEDKESARLVMDAFNRGEIREEFISRRSRGTTRAFEGLLNKD